jgi:acyl-coenzyme A synthetase/AMP-(fatty) acid ligase
VLKSSIEPADQLIGALQDHCKGELAPDFYKYPREIRFVGELPKTATGKIQRYRLRS